MVNRLHQRYPADLPALLLADDGAAPLAVQLKDISRGGAFVATPHEQAVGRRLTLQVADPELSLLSLPVLVVHRVSPEQAELWGNAAGLGLRFGELAAGQMDSLDAWLGGLAARLDRTLLDAPFDTSTLAQIEQCNRKGDLCGVLGLAPAGGCAGVARALDERMAALGALLERPDASGELRQRLIAARFVLQRAGEVLGDEQQRAGYLRRIGALTGDATA
jgi:hypothetical protein